MKSQVSKDIIRDLRRRFEITEVQAVEIIRSEFEMVSKTIESYSYSKKHYPNIRLPKFGLFFVKDKGKEHFNKK